MLDVSKCLEDIVGLSENDCPCFGTDEPVLGELGGLDVLGGLPGPGGEEVPESIERPSNYSDSRSGLYIDDQRFSIPLKFTGHSKDCGEGNIWDVLARSRKNGIRNFITDLGAGSKEYFRNRLHKFSGNTAGVSHNYTVGGLGDIIGVYIDPIQYKGAKGVLNEVELYVQGSGTFEVNVYSEYDFSAPINTSPISVSVNGNFGREKLAEPLTLSFSDEFARKVGYFVVYSSGGSDPRNIQFSCNCGNDLPWIKHFSISGVAASSLSELPTVGRNTQYPYGIRLHMDVTCGMDWLCRNWDFSNEWDRVASEAMMLYGVVELLERQLNDPQPVSTAAPETIQRKLKNARDLLGQRMPWLAMEIPLEESDCYLCKELYTVDEILI